LSPTQAYFLEDTIENRRQFERMGLKTFYLPELNDQQLSEMTNSLRVLLNLRFISLDKDASTLSIRAEFPVLEAADHLIQSLTTGRPEVLLDMRVYAVNSMFARSLGTSLPTQFTMYHIDQATLAMFLGGNSQNLINQLIASGGINQGNALAIAALLAQLQNSSSSSIPYPIKVFGGGLSQFAVTAGQPAFQGQFSVNDSDIRNLEHVTLRASHNDPAVMKIGERYPIINATYAPIYNSASIASVIGNQSYIAPFPSFNFEDLGVNLKATPWIHGNEDVTLKIELQIRALAGPTVNGIPVIANREYTGEITAKNGESSVVTGLIDFEDARAINGGLLSQVPGLGSPFSIHDKNVTQDELLVVITPHILRLPQQTSFAVQLPPGH
jgi:general secretion pathway protein D